ncbi:MAG: methionyl-tRNA formyltransferase [Novosphingobium sp.]
MRVIFMGTPAFAVPTLIALADRGHEVIAAYTQPPRPAGRGKQPQKSAVHLAAEARRIDVLHPISLKGADEQAAFAALGADIAVVAAYGLILPQAVLAAPRRGCLNLHASLLPRWRGAAPIQRAILAGDATTGMTIMRMEAGLDTGPMLARMAVAVERKTAGALGEELADVGARLIEGVLDELDSFAEVAQPAEGVTYAAKIAKAETRLDFAQTAEQVERQVRAFAPAPGAWFELAGERFRVLAADVVDATGPPGEVLDGALTVACGEGAIRVVTIQRAGKPAMEAAALLRGCKIALGTSLT